MEQLNLKITLNKNGSITSNWSSVTGAARYHLYMFTPGNSYAWVNEENLRTTSFTSQANLKANNFYQVNLAAYSSGGGTIASGSAKLLIPSDFYDSLPLSVPTNITATPSPVSVRVSFSTVERATSYDILFAGTTYNTTSTFKDFTGLTPKKSYSYSVRAKNSVVTGSYSSTRTVTTLPLTPAVPSNIRLTATENSVTVTWGSVSGATSYDILFNGSTYNVTGTSRTFTGLAANRSYTCSIRAKNPDASSAYSGTYTVTTAPSAPTAPTTTANDNSVTLSWGAVAGATSYDVLWNGTNYNVSGTTKTFSGLSPNTSYTYQIRSKNANGSSSYGTAKTVKTAPGAPSGDGVSVSTTKNSVTLSWGSVPGATSYDVIFNGTTYRVTTTSKTITGLSPGTSYNYQIRSNGAAGSGSYGSTKSVTTTPNAPSVPGNVSASVTPESATVSWGAVSGATSYDVYFAGTTYNTTATSTTIQGLKPDRSYTYRVCAKNAGGASSYSSSQTIRTPMNPPGVPLNVSATASYDSVTVSWNSVSGSSGYEVLFSGTTYSVAGTYKTITGLQSGANYNYSVRSKNTGGMSPYSATQTITTMLPVPQNVLATVTANTVTVSWDRVSVASSYDILFNGVTYNVNGLYKTFTGFAAGTTCTYKVRAKNSYAYSAYSASRSIQTTPNPPSTPTDVSAVVTSDSVTVNWSASTGASGYDVLFNDTVYSASGTSRAFTGLLSDTDYAYSVCAKNAGGYSPYSSRKSARTLLETPANVRGQADVYSLIIRWNPVPGAEGYDVRFDGTDYQVTDTFIEIDNLSPNTGYTFSVRATNEFGVSKYSSTESIKTLDDVLAVPTNVRATSTLNSVRVTWNPVKTATHYIVNFDDEMYLVSGVTGTFVSSRAAIPNYKRFENLGPDTVHTYCVKAMNERTTSEYSPLKTITTKKSKYNGLPNSNPNRKYPDGRRSHMGLDPVNALTGSFLWSYTFLEDYGKDALHFTVMYDSMRDEAHKALGKKWTYSLNYLLSMDEKSAYFSTPYDEVIAFEKAETGDHFHLAEGIRSGYTMRKENSAYIIQDVDGTAYHFNSQLCLEKMVENGLVTYSFQSNAEGQIISITGQHGASLRLDHSNGQISKVTDVLGNHVTFAYEGGCLISAVNPNGNKMSFTYDDQGNLLEITDFSGKGFVNTQYDLENRVVSQSTAGGSNTFATYNEENRTTVFTDELGNETVYTYDEEGHVTSVLLGATSVQSKYNSNGQLIEETDGLGNTTQMSYDECGRMNKVIHPDGTQEQITYNAQNYPIRILNRDRSETSYVYDAKNRLISAKDERGNTSIYTYDEQDNLLSYTEKNGNIWSYSYDTNGHLTKMTDPEGNACIYSHDALGRLISYTTAKGYATTYHYAPSGDLLRIVDGDGTLSFEYNENGDQTAVLDKRGNKQRLAYNDRGQVSLATDFNGNEYHFSYDQKGQLIQETDPLGYYQSYTYDERGNATSITDKKGNTTTQQFDAVNQLTQVKDPLGNTVTYTYDTMGQIKVITDALNHPTGYTYDAMGRVTCVTNALGDSISNTYDAAGNLLTQTDEKGNITSYVYDVEDQLVAIISNLGTIRFTYDKLGRVLTVEDFEGQKEIAEYDEDGNLTASTDQENHKTTYLYDAAGRLSKETDPLGNVTTYQYDKNGNCIQITDGAGGQFLYEYNANNQRTKETNPMGFSTSYGYNARGELVSVTDANGGITAFTYDANGNLQTEINPFGGEIVYTYDALNRLIQTVDEKGHTSLYAYDANGNQIAYTDANQNKWIYQYDALNRPICMTDEQGGSITVAYGKREEISKITDQEGAETLYTYDNNGRLTKMTDGLGNHLEFTYDKLGRIIKQTDARDHATTYQYSPTGNLLQVTDPEGGTTTYTYNAMGQILTETDAMGNAVYTTYNTLGQAATITDASGGIITFSYTLGGEIQTVTDPKGGITTYAYDGCSNLIKTTDPLGNVVSYEYDAMNNQIKEGLAAGETQTGVTLYHYDKKGQRIREIHPMLEERSYTYDGNGNVVTIIDEDQNTTTVSYDLNNQPHSMQYSDGKAVFYRYNKRGDLVEVKDWNGTTTMEYGTTGRLAKVTDHNGRSTAYRYDGNGNTIGMTYPDGSVVNYTYDKNNRMSTAATGEEQPIQYQYHPSGTIASIKQPGSTTTYAYNALNLPKQVKYQLKDGTGLERNITYDALGHMVNSKQTGSTKEFTRNSSYTYDALGQMLSCQDGEITESYGYDALGNRTFKAINGTQQATYQYNGGSQLTGKTEQGIPYSYAYDKRGNLVQTKRSNQVIQEYLYDATGHMVLGKNLETGEKTEYGYNGLSMRVKNIQTLENRTNGYQNHSITAPPPKPFRTKETTYAIDYLSGANNDLISYEKGFGSTKVLYGPGYERLSQKITLEQGVPVTPRMKVAATTIGTSYYQSDLLGSPLLASNEKGELLRHGPRNTWGELTLPIPEDLNTAGIENSLLFTNYSYDSVLDHYFAQARFYDAKQGRMLGKDPIKRGLNPYPYCKNSPENYVDPTGEVANVLIGGALGGVIGGTFGYVGSAISQKMNGEKFNSKKAWGAAANAAVVGAARGALTASGVGLLGSLGVNFGAGTLGSAFEQKIGTGKADFRESVTDGLTNAVSSAIYGNGKLKSLKSAFWRGAGAGAATAAINNLSDALKPRQTKRSGSGRNGSGNRYTGGNGRSPYTRMRNPRACGAPSAFQGGVGYRNTYGYKYEPRKTQHVKRNKFSIGSFAKDVLLGAVMGGLSSALFYGAGKGVEKLKRGIKGGTRAIDPNDIRFSQSSVNGAGEIIDSMKSNGWKGNPIDVVRMPDGKITTIDNTRVLAARYAKIDVKANIHAYEDTLPSSFIERFTTPKGTPGTWGNAVSLRIGNQNSIFRTTYPQGSNIIGWKGN